MYVQFRRKVIKCLWFQLWYFIDASFASMLSRIQSYLAQPYPFNADPRNYFKVVLVFTAFVGGFLAFFQPFGINNLPGHQPWLVSAGFAAVTFVSLLIFLGLTQLFPSYFQEDDWTLGRELFFSLLNFLLVGHANFLFIKFAWLREYEILDYMGMLLGTFAVGFFPYLFMLLTQHMTKLRRNVSQAEALNERIVADQEPKINSAEVKFTGDNESDELTLNLDKLLFVQSAGNYIEVVYNDGQHVNKSILRNSISNAESVLASFENVYRCHRKFLVNLERVSKVEGNSQGYRLQLDHDVEQVPVARTKNTEFRDKLQGIHTHIA